MRLILTRGSDQSLRATRVKYSLGSFNAVRRREFFFGDEGDRVNDNTRGRFETNRHEKLNDESPKKGLPVRKRRDATKSEAVLPTGRGALVVSAPRNEARKRVSRLRQAGRFGRTAKPRAHKALSDVTSFSTTAANWGIATASD